MSSSMAAALLRRALRPTTTSSILSRHPRPRFYSSRASSPLIRTPSPQSLGKQPSSLLAIRLASTNSSAGESDDKLKRVLDSEIDCAEQAETLEITLPDEFPFEIIDNPGDQTITLTREFAGESIQVTVLTTPEEDDVEDDEDNSEDDNNDVSIHPAISLVVNIDKGEGSVVEFCCSLKSDELSIESMTMKKRDDPDDEAAYQGPVFSDLDETLQKALHKYLEARGIKSSMFSFLNEYMISKDDKEYMGWLKNMKKFLEA